MPDPGTDQHAEALQGKQVGFHTKAIHKGHLGKGMK